MSLRHLRVDGVRCLSAVALDLHPERNYFWGANGAGKTSLLEGIYLLARGRSFRTRQTARLIAHGRHELSVFGQVEGSDRALRRLGVAFSRGRLQTQIDGQPAPGQAEMLRILPVHVLDPRLHRLIEAGPSERRRFIDAGVFHVEQSFLEAWRQYRRVLGQRNAALKGQLHDSEIEIWREPFLQAASSVDQARKAYCEEFSEIVAELGEELLGTRIRVQYRAGWRQDSTLESVLDEHVDRDRASGYTQIGPHRADLKLDFADGGIRDIASRGQQKLVAAALVIAQVMLYEKRTGNSSTVLVDDASAELDQGAQQRLTGALDRLRSQQILTGLSPDILRPAQGFPMFHVEQGKVHPVV